MGLTFELDPSASGTAASASRHQPDRQHPAGVGGAAAGLLAWHAAAAGANAGARQTGLTTRLFSVAS